MGNPMDRGSWQATVHIVKKSQTGLSHFLLFNRSVRYKSLRPHRLRHARLPYPSPTTRAYSNSCPYSWWCHPTISSSVILFSSWLQSVPSLGSFLMSQPFASGGQDTGASASVLPMNIHGWFPLGLIAWISLQSKGLSRVFSNQFSSVQLLHHVQLFSTHGMKHTGFPVYHHHQLPELLKLMSIESVMPSNHLILCHPLLLPPSIFPSIRVFSNESVLRITWPNIGVSASASVLPMTTQDWFPLGWTGWISL